MARPAAPHTREQLLRAAEAEFVAHGLDRAKVAAITARAGCSKGAFYLHFASKEDAFRQLVEGLLARLGGCVEANRVREDEHGPHTPQELAAAWLAADRQVFEFLWQNRPLFRLIFEGGRSAQYGHLIEAFAEGTRGRTREFLRWAMARGLCRDDLDPEVTSLLIIGAYEQLARELCKREDRPDLERWLSELSAFVLRAITRSGASARLEPVREAARPPRARVLRLTAAPHRSRRKPAPQGDDTT